MNTSNNIVVTFQDENVHCSGIKVRVPRYWDFCWIGLSTTNIYYSKTDQYYPTASQDVFSAGFSQRYIETMILHSAFAVYEKIKC